MTPPDSTKTDGIVYVVDDDELVRRAMARKFKSLGFQVLSFASAAEFLDAERAEMPGCLLLDVEMPGQSGIDLQQELSRHQVDLPIVFMTGHGNIPTAVKAMQNGAVDFLSKPVNEEQLLQTVQRAIERHAHNRQESTGLAEFRKRVETLSKREREVMHRVISGMLNKQIARRLGITEDTVKAHRRRVMTKTGVVSLAELVRLCEKSGIAPWNQ